MGAQHWEFGNASGEAEGRWQWFALNALCHKMPTCMYQLDFHGTTLTTHELHIKILPFCNQPNRPMANRVCLEMCKLTTQSLHTAVKFVHCMGCLG